MKHSVELILLATALPLHTLVAVQELEAWSHRLKVFDNRVLRKISGPKREEVTGDWKN
jgi:hypothetical protein